MRRILFVLAGVAAAIVCADASAMQTAKVIRISGKVEISSGSGWRAAMAGDAAPEGAKVKTGADAEAYLAWPDGHNVKVAPLSLVTVAAPAGGKGADLKLASGKVFAASGKTKGASFNVRTPSAVAGVRGTKFSVDSKGGAAATLVSVQGAVQIKKPGDDSWGAASNNMKAPAGSEIKTGPGGSCAVAWAKGNVVKVNSLTRMTLDELGGGAGADSSLSVAQGKVAVRAKKQTGGAGFSVRTPSAVAGVRGTKFSVESKPGAGATLASVKGGVEVLEAGGSGWAAAKVNMNVSSGATIRTGPGGSCAVAWSKGNIVKVNPLTKVTLDALGASSRLMVEDGKIAVQAKKVSGGSSFTVRTPTAVAGVRGTKFSVESKSAGTGAALVSVKGDVSYQAPGSGSWTEAKSSAKLPGGSTIKTGAGASCVVAWAKGNVMKIEALTKITLSKLGAAGDADTANDLRLERGTVAVRARKLQGAGASFTVRTPTAVAGVRGTKFSVTASGDESKPDTKVMVAEGEVVLTAGGTDVDLSQGQKSTAANGAAPSPAAQMSQAELESLNSAAELDDPANLEIGGGTYKTDVMVAEGSVAVTSDDGQTVDLAEGMKSSVGEGVAPSAPAAMTSSELQELKSDPDLNSPALLEMGAAGGGPSSEIMVAEGSVSVTSEGGESVDLGEGMKSSVGDGSAPEAPSAMSASELQELNSASELDDPAVLEIGDSGKSSSDIMVAEGNIAVTSETGDVVELAMGMKTSVDEGAAPDAPTPMSSEELSEINSETAGLEDMSIGDVGAGIDSGGGSGSSGGSGDDSSAGAIDSVIDSVDAVLDNNVINDTIDSAQTNEGTFDIDVDVYFGQ